MDLTVVIVRHGNTFAVDEPPRRIGAATDLPLVPSGLAQAQTLGVALARTGPAFTRALAAPLLRTRATIDAILAEQPHPPRVETANWLTEIDHGPDEEQLETDVVARIGHAALARWDGEAVAPAGWVVDAERRSAGWRDLLTTAHGRLLIVTSNGAARFALHADPVLQRQAAALPSLKLRTGAYAIVTRDRGMLELTAWDLRP